MKKYSKIISILLTVVLIASISTSVLAFSPKNVTPIMENTNGVAVIGNRIMGIIQVVGTIAAVIILIVLGIKYMMGSAQEKAEYKKTMIPYIIGAILIFAASSIANMIYGWASTLNTTETGSTSIVATLEK